MRHEKGARLLTLARLLASSAEGLTLDEMARALAVGRRTAERMRDAVREVFPDLEEIDDPPTRRFRIPGGLDGVFQSPTAEELAALRAAADALESAGAGVRAAALRVLEQKILGQARASARRRIAPDLEALVQAETIAVYAGPRPFENAEVLATVRAAIKSLRTLTFVYDGGRAPGRDREVAPYGVLFGRSNYLVAADLDGAQAGVARSWRFDRMRAVRLGDRAATAPPDFSLSEFALESFGIYHGAPEDVVLRIDAAKADEARAWRFHPRQTIETRADGSVEVRFRAGGMLELAWHLFSWGDAVEILAPPSLRDTMVEALQASLSRHGPGNAAGTARSEVALVGRTGAVDIMADRQSDPAASNVGAARPQPLAGARNLGQHNPDDNLKAPTHEGQAPRPATEPDGAEHSTTNRHTDTDPATGEPNPAKA